MSHPSRVWHIVADKQVSPIYLPLLAQIDTVLAVTPTPSIELYFEVTGTFK